MTHIQSIASRVKLVTLTRRHWTARAASAEGTRELNASHNTDAAQASVTLSKHPALAAITKAHTGLYQEHIKMTRPTIQDGTRLVTAGLEFEHAEAVRKCRDAVEPLIESFLADYDTERADAPRRLNGLYNAKNWPTKDRMRDKFETTVLYLPCPSDGAWAEWISESARAATADLRERLEAAVRRVAVRCADNGGEGKLHATVFTGLRELVAAIPDLDLSDSDEIMRLAEHARSLAELDADQVRDDPATRADLATRANSILDMFAAGSLA